MEIERVNKQLKDTEDTIFSIEHEINNLEVEEDSFSEYANKNRNILETIREQWAEEGIVAQIDMCKEDVTNNEKLFFNRIAEKRDDLIRDKKKLLDIEEELIHEKRKLMQKDEG